MMQWIIIAVVSGAAGMLMMDNDEPPAPPPVAIGQPSLRPLADAMYWVGGCE